MSLSQETPRLRKSHMFLLVLRPLGDELHQRESIEMPILFAGVAQGPFDIQKTSKKQPASSVSLRSLFGRLTKRLFLHPRLLLRIHWLRLPQREKPSAQLAPVRLPRTPVDAEFRGNERWKASDNLIDTLWGIHRIFAKKVTLNIYSSKIDVQSTKHTRQDHHEGQTAV